MGLMCALSLLARGRRVVVVEAESCGGGASGRSSGFITPDSELELQDVVRKFGATDGRKLWEFGRSGVAAIQSAIEHNRIACGYEVQDSLFVAATAGGAKTTQAEHAVYQELGYASTYYDRSRLREVLGSEAYFGGIRFGGTFGIDGWRCCLGLRTAITGAGGLVYEDSPVRKFGQELIETQEGRVRAPHVLVCVDRFLPTLGCAPKEIYHVQTFLAISGPLPDAAVGQLFPGGNLMVWDTDLIYKYFRLTEDRRLLIGGCTLATTYASRERHNPEAIVKEMTRYLAQRFPWLRLSFTAAWPGLIGISKDFAPVVGQHPGESSVYFAGGAAGLPWAAALGRYLAEKVLDGRDDLDEPLAVTRHFPIGRRVQALIGTPGAFAISHGMAKYLGR
jgi:gamma-glutamylputrescine oxidase